MNPLIIYLHIPKTGGTSLRVSARGFFGEERMLYDYGLEARQTSPLVREWIYERQDLAGFAAEVQGGDYRFLSGHMPRDRYEGVFPDALYVSWVREPVSRIWSAYRHYRRHHGYEDGPESFYTQPRFINQQSRLLGKRPDRLAFVGVMEHYERSLAQFNECLGLDFEQVRANRAPKSEESEAGPPAEIREHIQSLNCRDMELHQAVVDRLQEA